MMGFETFQELLRYVRWAGEDEGALRGLLPHVEPRVTEISEEFYERIREHPAADAVFRDEAQVRRLKRTLEGWVIGMLKGPFDRAYYEQRGRIGAVHARIGVPQRYVFTAMSLVRLHLERILDGAYQGDPGRARGARVALGKILDVELGVMLETYREAMIERVERVERQSRDSIARRLEAAEARYRDAIESSPALVVVLDPDESPLVWNQTASRLTGYERDELQDRSPLDLLLDGEARARIRQVQPDAPDSFDAVLWARSGRERHVRWWVSSRPDPDHRAPLRYLLGIDFTEVREAERRARNAERLAAVGTMAAGLAHEIRNPLNAASLHVTLLERSLAASASTNDTAREAAVVLRGELKRLSSLLNEFLEFARPRPLRMAPASLGALVASVAELLRPDAVTAQVTLVYERPAREVWAELDEERMRQVLINLIRNAIEAAKDRVTLRVRRVNSSAEFDVEDDGPGIPDGTPIFDAFFTTKESGTGLGLSIVHRIVDDHGGSVRVQSVPGETVFTVRLAGVNPPSGTDVALKAPRDHRSRKPRTETDDDERRADSRSSPDRGRRGQRAAGAEGSAGARGLLGDDGG